MSKDVHHEALYRRWRPQVFKEIIGQEHVSRTLSNAITSGRIAHAYLFCGPRGTGKTSTARILAKALNCAEGPTPEPCGICRSCAEIAEASSLDVIEVDAASYRQVDETQEVLKGVHLAPAGGRRKIYIIDEVHMLSAHSFNALLKTLEEPPEHVVFVLATTEPHRVLPTVLSRCQRFDFHRISGNELVDHLRSVAEAEEIEITEEALALIARHAQGSVRDALGALEQLVGFAGKRRIQASDATRLLGAVEFDVLSSIVDRIHDGKVADALAVLHQLLEGGRDARTFTAEIIGYLRQLFLLQHAGEDTAFVDVVGEERDRLINQASRIKPSRTLAFLDAFGDAYERSRGSDARLILEMTFIRLARPETDVSVAGILERLDRLEAAGVDVKNRAVQRKEKRSVAALPKSEPLPSERRTAENTDAAGSDLFKHLSKNWGAVLEKLKKKPAVRACLIEAEPVGLEGKRLALEFSPKANFHRERVKKEYGDVIIAAIKEVTGVEVLLDCLLRDSGEATVDEAIRYSVDEVVGLVADEFDAKIIEESSVNKAESPVPEEGP